MKAAIVDNAGKLLYWGNTANPKFATTLPGNTRVDVPPDGNDTWDGAAWSTSPPPVVVAPLDAEELYDILAAKGILLPQDRPRPRKP